MKRLIEFLRNPLGWQFVFKAEPTGSYTLAEVKILGLHAPEVSRMFSFTVIGEVNRFGKRRVRLLDLYNVDKNMIKNNTPYQVWLDRWIREGDDAELKARFRTSFESG